MNAEEKEEEQEKEELYTVFRLVLVIERHSRTPKGPYSAFRFSFVILFIGCNKIIIRLGVRECDQGGSPLFLAEQRWR